MSQTQANSRRGRLLYRFDIDGTQISPAESTPDQEGNPVSIPAVTTKRVVLQIQLTDATADEISSASPIGDPYTFDEGAHSRTNMLDSAVFGVACCYSISTLPSG